MDHDHDHDHELRQYESVSALSSDTHHLGKRSSGEPSYHAHVTEVPSPFTPTPTISSFNKRARKQQRTRRSAPLKFWTWEIISLFLTIGLIVAIVAILSHFEGRPLPDWPFGINLSTLVALLSTILRTLMLVAVAEALGQLKWTWFSSPSSSSSSSSVATVPRPLHDFHIFDRASRGILGSMRLLTTVKHRSLWATVGCLVTILSLSIGPFTQQALKNVNCQRAVAKQNSSVAVAHFMGIPDSFQGSFSRGPGWYALPNDMKGAMISGLINPTGNDSSVSATCQTGNCTFSAAQDDDNITYSSIGMCSKCIDTTSLAFANETLSNQSIGWQLPNGMQIELSIMAPILNVTTNDNMSWASALFTDDYAVRATQALANVTMLSFTRAPCTTTTTTTDDDDGTGTVTCPHNITNTFRDFAQEGAWDVVATSCALYPCLQNYHGDVEEGVFTETVVSTAIASYNWPSAAPAQEYFPLAWTDLPPGNWTALKDPCVIDGVAYPRQTNYSDVPRTATRNFTLVHSSSSSSSDDDDDDDDDGSWGYYLAPEECVYTLSAQYVMGLYDWMTQTLFAGTCVWPDDTALVGLAEPDCSNQFWLSPLWNTRNASFASLATAMDALAAAVTNKFRTDGQPNWYEEEEEAGGEQHTDWALGVVYETTVCVAVNWEWLLMPIILAALSTLLLGAMIVQGLRNGEQQPVWKSSVLPLLFYGPDNDTRLAGEGGAAADLGVLSRESQRTAMTFRNGPAGAGFVEKEDPRVRNAEIDSLMGVELDQR